LSTVSSRREVHVEIAALSGVASEEWLHPVINVYNSGGLAGSPGAWFSIAALSNGQLCGSDDVSDAQTYYHGTKADLEAGDLIEPGYASNFGKRKQAAFVYLTATMDAAIWGAELALGAGRGRIYLVEPTGPIEDDPNLTDKKFPGNITKSYRSRAPFRVIGEVLNWTGHPAEQLKAMLDRVEYLRQEGVEAIE
jgi:hypothetical protein